jgi:CheY-like chemotaxis protein
MFAGIQDFLTSYMVPLAIAVPVAALLILLVIRRKKDDVRRPRQPNLPPAPAPARAPAPPMSIASFAPLPPRAPMPSAVPAPRPVAVAPVAPPAPSAPIQAGAPAATAEPAPAPAPISLLVADDSAVARAKLRKLFESAGYQVDVAADGEEALELLTRKPYAVLITDLEMPRMDGFQVIAAVLGSLETEDLPIIAITGHEELSARVHDMQGLFGIFKKPWNDRELLRRVAAVSTLRRQAAAD